MKHSLVSVLALAAAACSGKRESESRPSPRQTAAAPSAVRQLPTANRTSSVQPWVYVTVHDGILHVAKTIEALDQPQSAIDSANLLDRLVELSGVREAGHEPRGMKPLWTMQHQGGFITYNMSGLDRLEEARLRLWQKQPVLLLDANTRGVDLPWIAEALGSFSARLATGAAKAVHAVTISQSTISPFHDKVVLVLENSRLTVIGRDGLTIHFEPVDGRPNYSHLARVLTLDGFRPGTTEARSSAAERPVPPPLTSVGTRLMLINRDSVSDMMPILDLAADHRLARLEVAYYPPRRLLHEIESLEMLEKEIRTRQSWPVELALNTVFDPSGPLPLSTLKRVMQTTIDQAARDYHRNTGNQPSLWQAYMTITVDPDGTVAEIRPYGDGLRIDSFSWLEDIIRSARFPAANAVTRFSINLRGTACWPGSGPSQTDGTWICTPDR